MADLTISQEALDAQIAAAVATATEAAVAAAIAPFGDYEALKVQLADVQKQNETETQRLVREAKEAAEASVPEKVSAATAAARESLVTAELRSFAVTLGFKYPEDVINLLRDHKDLEVTDKFQVKGAEKLVKELAAKRPEWLQPVGSFTPGRPATTPGEGAREETPEQEAIRRQRMRQIMGVSARTF